MMKLTVVACGVICLAGSSVAYEPDNQLKCVLESAESTGCLGFPYGTFTYHDVHIAKFARHKCDDPSKIALTFHSAANAETSTLLTRLSGRGIRATFFVNGALVDESTKPIIKSIEDAGHTIAYGGMTFTGMADLGDGLYSTFDELFHNEFEKLNETLSEILDHPVAPFWSPPFRSYDMPLIADLGEKKGILTVLPNLNFESPDTEQEVEEHLSYLYDSSAGGPTYRKWTDERMGTYMADAAEYSQSYITQMSASQPKAEAFIADYFYYTASDKNYKFVDLKECLGYDIQTQPDKRVSRCAGAPCDAGSQCRSKFNVCGTGSDYCNADSLYIPQCAEDLSLGEAGTPAPTTSPSPAPSLAPTEHMPTAPSVPAYCEGTPCRDTADCRSGNNVCGVGPQYCNAESLWQPDCAGIVGTPPPTASQTAADDPETQPPTAEVQADVENPTACKGAPCEDASECRSAVTFECGRSPEFCNMNAIWTSECSPATSSASREGYSVAQLAVAGVAFGMHRLY